MNILERPLAITDVETTGLDAHIHEIIELGLLLVDQKTLEIVDEYEAKIKPIRLDVMNPQSLEVNGYNETDWQNAPSLQSVMDIYATKTQHALFVAHNVTFDWSFIDEAFKRTGAKNRMDYHRIDLLTIAWSRVNQFHGLTKLSLDALCEYFDIPKEPRPHRAINGVRNELAVLQKLLQV
ncbi:MAG: 3'-5' exonuclease [Patescibacteria group bacterium]|nr:3'-5' exonuclease [Patescibacteria group bacterium]MDE2438084.1 3'-5' exonuclease [Patescibacteria group bacterium]